MKLPILRRRSAEEIEADTKRHYDGEKVATATVDRNHFRGVRFFSRYDKYDELETMVMWLAQLSAMQCRDLVEVWCDSKACCVYSITIKPTVPFELAPEIAESLQSQCFLVHGGHNGIYVRQGEEIFELVSDWLGDR